MGNYRCNRLGIFSLQSISPASLPTPSRTESSLPILHGFQYISDLPGLNQLEPYSGLTCALFTSECWRSVCQNKTDDPSHSLTKVHGSSCTPPPRPTFTLHRSCWGRLTSLLLLVSNPHLLSVPPASCQRALWTGSLPGRLQPCWDGQGQVGEVWEAGDLDRDSYRGGQGDGDRKGQ